MESRELTIISIGGITLLTEVSEAADLNRNRSSSRGGASLPFTRNFSENLGLKY